MCPVSGSAMVTKLLVHVTVSEVARYLLRVLVQGSCEQKRNSLYVELRHMAGHVSVRAC